MAGIIGMLSMAEAAVLLIVFVVYFALLLKLPKYFGEFINFSKLSSRRKTKK